MMKLGLWAWFATIAIGAFAPHVAFSADLPTTKSPAPPIAVWSPSWTGFYGGVNAGWGWSSISDSETPLGTEGIAGIYPESFDSNLNGGVFGVQAGYNWQMNNWVIGLEGDFDAASINGGNRTVFADKLGGSGNTATDGFMARQEIDWLASIRARLGVTWGQGLAYVTGGAAWEDAHTKSMISVDTDPDVYSQSAVGSFGAVKSGFVLGAGYEWMISPHWTMRAEYLFYDFGGSHNGAISIPDCENGGCGVNVKSGSNNISTIRVGVNYLFNAPGPSAGLPPAMQSWTPKWTGFYVGANGGWGWSNIDASETPLGTEGIAGIYPVSASSAMDGGVFGAQVGFNWQMNNWIVGFEGDFDGASINGVSQTVFPDKLMGAGGTATDGFMTRQNVDWLASIRARLGAIWGPGLAYATGGAAWEDVQTYSMISTDTDPAVFSQSATGSTSATRAGYALGAGYEWMIAPRFTIRAEYLFYGFGGSHNAAVPILDCGGCGVNVRSGSNNISTIRVGLNYLFN